MLCHKLTLSNSFSCLLRGSEVRASISWATGGRWKWSHMSPRRKLGRNWWSQSTGRCACCCCVFTNNGRPHCMDEFSQGNLPSSELQIYPWMDATLKELISSVKEVYQEAGKKNTLQFRNFRSFKTWLLSKGDWQHPVQEKGDWLTMVPWPCYHRSFSSESNWI